MKSSLVAQIKLLGIGIIFAVGASYVFASWNTPPSSPPKNNTSRPIHVGTSHHIKEGGLSVNAFSAYQNAQIGGTAYIGRALTGANDTVVFGTTDHKAALAVTGGLIAQSYMQSDTLAGHGDNIPLCSDKNGTIILCLNASSVANNPDMPVLTLTHGAPGAQGKTNFILSLSKPIAADITISKIVADGYNTTAANPSCSVTNDIASDNGSNIILQAKQTALTATGTTTGNWDLAKKATVYKLTINSIALEDGDTVLIGNTIIRVALPVCQ